MSLASLMIANLHGLDPPMKSAGPNVLGSISVLSQESVRSSISWPTTSPTPYPGRIVKADISMPPSTRDTGARPRTNKAFVIPASRINYVLPPDQGKFVLLSALLLFIIHLFIDQEMKPRPRRLRGCPPLWSEDGAAEVTRETDIM